MDSDVLICADSKIVTIRYLVLTMMKDTGEWGGVVTRVVTYRKPAVNDDCYITYNLPYNGNLKCMSKINIKSIVCSIV